MSGLCGDLTWTDIDRGARRWYISDEKCLCGKYGLGSDSLHDPDTGELVGWVCGECEREYDTTGAVRR